MMTAVKMVALSVLVCGVLTSAVQADPITFQWTTWQPGVGLVSSAQTSTVPWTPLGAPLAAMTVPAQPTTTSAATSAPELVAAPAPVAATASPAPSPAPAPSTPSPSTVDAFINLGTGPYPDASSLTTGNAQPWYNSSQITGLFGGQPTSTQQAAFDSAVVQRVEQTFQLSGVPITLTTNPNVPAAHTLSVVSSTESNSVSNAIGMTYLGGNGFHFIDQSAKAAQSVGQLEWIIAHNISHELMLAFGVGENYDTSGNYIDARNANWSMMTNPNAKFSSAASQALLSANFNSNNTLASAAAQVLEPQPVPEPATIALWTTVVAAAFVVRRARMRRV